MKDKNNLRAVDFTGAVGNVRERSLLFNIVYGFFTWTSVICIFAIFVSITIAICSGAMWLFYNALSMKG